MNVETSSEPWGLISNTLKGLLFLFRLARTTVPSVPVELKNLDVRQRTSIGLKQLSQTLSLLAFRFERLVVRKSGSKEVGNVQGYIQLGVFTCSYTR